MRVAMGVSKPLRNSARSSAARFGSGRSCFFIACRAFGVTATPSLMTPRSMSSQSTSQFFSRYRNIVYIEVMIAQPMKLSGRYISPQRRTI